MFRTNCPRIVGAALVGLALCGAALAHSGGTGSGGGAAGGNQGGAGSGSAGSAAAGTHSDDSSATASQRVPVPQCTAGYVFAKGSCVRLHAGVLPDDELYRAGRQLALAGAYTVALSILEAVQRTDDPMVFTMRGYATRKLGRFHEAMALYGRALAIDPDNVNTHEYIGEGYVTTGRIDLARVELAKVEQGCGGSACEQYEDLARAIDTGEVE